MIFAVYNEPKRCRSDFKELFKDAGRIVTQVGDYSMPDIDGHVLGIERKRWRDLLDSISDGRLKRQMVALARAYTHRVLLLEGGHQRTEGGMIVLGSELTGYRSAAVQGLLWTVRRRHKIEVVETSDWPETLEWLRIMHNRASRACFDG